MIVSFMTVVFCSTGGGGPGCGVSMVVAVGASADAIATASDEAANSPSEKCILDTLRFFNIPRLHMYACCSPAIAGVYERMLVVQMRGR